MVSQQGLLLNSVVYQKVVNAIGDVQKQFDNPERWEFDPSEDFRVIWESETHSHPSTSYVIEGFDSLLGDPTMIIRGGGGKGGKYEIIPKSDNPTWMRYHRPDGRIGWEEELTKLLVVTPEFKYVKENGWAWFFTNVYSILEEVGKIRP